MSITVAYYTVQGRSIHITILFVMYNAYNTFLSLYNHIDTKLFTQY